MRSKVVNPSAPGAEPAPALKRRGLLLGAGVAGAAVLAAKALPGTATEVVEAAVKPALDPAGGYQLTPHVLRYYETTKV
jgi:2-polyprenyl-6-methoxyphenol hydroxylase-like FAD-dependent oxidoreductase